MHHRANIRASRPIGLVTLAALATLTIAWPAVQAATGLVDFDPPGTAQGPSIFVAVPAMQTLVMPEATFSGGVALGFATFFPAIAFATSPNVYGTASFGNGLATTLTIDVAQTVQATQVGFALFNGASLVASQTVANILPNWNSGYALVDMANAGGITRVTVQPVNPPPGVWDFVIDTVVFNQTLQQALPNLPPPPVYTPQSPPPVTMAPVTVTYTEPDTVDAHGHKQKGKTKTVQNQFINYGDDSLDAKGHFESVTTPVPEPATIVLMLAGLGLIGVKARRNRG